MKPKRISFVQFLRSPVQYKTIREAARQRRGDAFVHRSDGRIELWEIGGWEPSRYVKRMALLLVTLGGLLCASSAMAQCPAPVPGSPLDNGMQCSVSETAEALRIEEDARFERSCFEAHPGLTPDSESSAYRGGLRRLARAACTRIRAAWEGYQMIVCEELLSRLLYEVRWHGKAFWDLTQLQRRAALDAVMSVPAPPPLEVAPGVTTTVGHYDLGTLVGYLYSAAVTTVPMQPRQVAARLRAWRAISGRVPR